MANFLRNTFLFLNNITSTLNSATSNHHHPDSRLQQQQQRSTSGFSNHNRNRSNHSSNTRLPDNNTGNRNCTVPPGHQHNRSSQSRQSEQINMNNNPHHNPISQQQPIKNVEKFDIQDVRDPNDINNLSAKQLKTILTINCIDFRGIFEKEVLREKVLQLWIDHNERKARRKANNNQATNSNGSQDGSDDIDEKHVCKICWEREIDCVLLECGHMATCLICGKKCNDCPICRQSITRCVRTFKV